MKSVEEALDILFESLDSALETESVPLLQAAGRVLSESIASSICNPPFDRSPLDGYAYRSEDGDTLCVIDEVDAGDTRELHIDEGECVRIMTGAPIPSGADCVVRQEDTDYGESCVHIARTVSKGMNICRKGEDYRPGDLLARKGDVITPVHIGVLSSAGISTVEVFRSVRVAVISTGSELSLPGKDLEHGRIYDANGPMLVSRLAELGAEVIDYRVFEDDAKKVAEYIRSIVERVDIILTSGGVSVGRMDIMHSVSSLLGAERLFWKVDVKPGTPLLALRFRNRPVISLSGNPFAALAGFEVFARPVISKLSGRREFRNRLIRTTFRGVFSKISDRRRLVRAYYDGSSVSLLKGCHSSGALTSAIGTNCLLDIPAGKNGLQDGESVDIIYLR
ncbi:MAG: molybdopterin molybdotransferase MoeA [Spirochaetales bacterium]|nr:molybdopterin molybdotransferase MoeA [Spirochaetales bacterium]